ncbi:MAG: M15 family metallopeptidase [Armatimonadaceae bacterium]
MNENPPKTTANKPRVKPISPNEPVSELRSIPIRDNGEELVDFLELCPCLLLDRPRFRYKRETLLRRGVAERLCLACQSLPSGYRIAVVEGWRPPYIQKRMYERAWRMWQEKHPHLSETALKRLTNRYTAPMNPRVPPPHTTGGAIDLVLTDADGKPLDMQSIYGEQDEKGFAFDAPNLSPEARKHRKILAEALIAQGITNYPAEFWHWSYGDQGWAYRGGHPQALYAAIEPPGWQPNPEDNTAEPLEWI